MSHPKRVRVFDPVAGQLGSVCHLWLIQRLSQPTPNGVVWLSDVGARAVAGWYPDALGIVFASMASEISFAGAKRAKPDDVLRKIAKSVRTTLKPSETIVVWYLRGNQIIPGSLRLCRISSIHSMSFTLASPMFSVELRRTHLSKNIRSRNRM